MRAALLLCSVLSVGCDAMKEEIPRLFATSPGVTFAASPTPTQAEHLDRVARRIATKLNPPALPAVGSVVDCSRATTVEAIEPEARQIALANVDVRTQTKNLVPRRVSERLESGEMALLSSQLDIPTQPNTPALRNAAPVSASSLTRDDLNRIEHQRYLGVFYITQYQGPALILRVGKIRREWFEGSLSAKFLLFDTERHQALCSAELRVKNDVRDAPIRSRLQAETRNRLERALGDALRREAGRAASRVAPQLQWPDSGT